jgi:hypothetical protein
MAYHDGPRLVEQGKLLCVRRKIARHQERNLIVDFAPFLLNLRRRDVFLGIGVKRLIRHVFRLENNGRHRESQRI